MNIMICDLHNDYLTGECAFKIMEKYESQPLLVVAALFKGKKSFDKTVSLCEKFKSASPKNSILAFEDMGYENFSDIIKLIDYQPLYCTLTWNGENNLGFGCMSDGGGLKAAGLELIKQLNNRKIFVDTAHLNKGGFYDVIDNARYVLDSHTAFNSICRHIRNITDEQAKLIVERGGVIGLCLYDPFIKSGGGAQLCDLVRHIDYFVQRYGDKNLCIGSDFFGATEFVGAVADYSGFYKIEYELKRLGYRQSSIDNLFYRNFERKIKNFYLNITAN